MSSNPQDPANQGSQENLFLDARDEFNLPVQDVQDHQQPLDDFKVLFRNKNANLKRRITITINSLTPLERDNVSLHIDDVELVRKHLKQADKALDTLNEVLDDATDDLGEEVLRPFVNAVHTHTPQIMDLRARINVIQAKISQPGSDVQQPVQTQQLLSSFKIDHTFRPDPLDVDATPAVFQQWQEQFLVYSERNSFDRAPFKQQKILLLKCLTPSMQGTLKRVCSDTASTLTGLLKEIENYITTSNNLMMRHYNYFNCVQRPGESYEDYIVRFRDVGDYAGFDTFTYDENLTCRLVTGILDEELRAQLIRLPKPTFQTVKDFVLTWKVSKSSASSIAPGVQHSSTQSAQDVNRVSAYRQNKKHNFHKRAATASSAKNKSNDASNQHTQRSATSGRAAPPSGSSSSDRTSCKRCGYSHATNAFCPAVGQECAYCKIVGHFKTVCQKNLRRKNQVNHVSEPDPHNDPDVSLDEIDTDQGGVNIVDCAVFQVDTNKPRAVPKIPAEFKFCNVSHSASVLPDTGAAVSVMPAGLLSSWNWQSHVLPTTNVLRSADGSDIKCHGTITLQVSVFGASHDVDFYVCPGVRNVLLSWLALRDLSVVRKHFPWPSPDVSQVHHIAIDTYKQSLITAFPKVFTQSDMLAPMSGEPMRIHLKSNIDWSDISKVFKPRPIPIPLRHSAKTELDSMLDRDIIMPVHKPTPFVSPLLVVPKKGGAVRLVIDYTNLNKYVRRPVHPFPSVQEVRAMIPPDSKYFATMDALQGYWQVPLHESSRELTTFLTPWGRFCFKRAPMGLSSSGDEYCKRGDVAFQGIKNVIKVVDDLLIHAPTFQSLQSTIQEVLMAARSNGISLSSSKLHIGQSVSFVGLNITDHGITPDPKHLRALAEFPVPQNKTDLRSFLGLVNQFAAFSTTISQDSGPLRPLLSASSTWTWTPEHQQAFENIRNLLVQSPILQYFSPQLDTKLLTDASRLNGLGYVLMQRHGDKWSVVSCGSRTINNTEANYAVCELEALAIVWAIQKCRIYLMGLPSFTVVTDHRPLVTIFNSSHLLRNDNPRLLRLLQKVASYTFQVEWIPGKMHKIPDALSRAPVPVNAISDYSSPDIVEPVVRIEDPSLAKLQDQAKKCTSYQDLIHAVSNMSLQDVKRLPSHTHGHVRAFASMWDRLSYDSKSGLVLLDASRIIVPSNSRRRILDLAHASHQGISRMKARLQSIYFWHGMGNDVTQMVQSCNLCLKFRPSQPSQPLTDPQMPSYPFQRVSCDLFDYNGSHTIVYVDRFTGYPLVAHFHKSPTSNQIIKALSGFFKDFGIPESLRHDGARPLVSKEFTSFLLQNNIVDELSAAYFPQSNGHAEAAVKSIKLLVKKCWITRQLDLVKFNFALLEWRNTPRSPGGRSPAELLFKRKIRTLLPAIDYNNISHSNVMHAVTKNYEYLKNAYRKINYRRRPLTPLKSGDFVAIRDPIQSLWNRTGTVKSIRKHGHSYHVESGGKSFLRNRKHLKRIPVPQESSF